MITLYWFPRTRAVRMFWALEEIGQPCVLEPVDIRAATRSDPPGFLAASPLRKVPALADGKVCVADAAAIALYLADRYAPGELAPAADPARGEFLFWLLYTPFGDGAGDDREIHRPALQPCRLPMGSFDRMLAALETRLTGREWIAADRFTMADFMIAGTIEAMGRFRLLDPSPVLSAHMRKCLARPGAIRGRRGRPQRPRRWSDEPGMLPSHRTPGRGPGS